MGLLGVPVTELATHRMEMRMTHGWGETDIFAVLSKLSVQNLMAPMDVDPPRMFVL